MNQTKEKIKSNKTRNFLILILCLLSIFIYSLYKKNNRNDINRAGRIGIFYVEKIQFSKSIPAVFYSYYDHGKIRYDSYTCSDVSEISPGDRYFGKYMPNTNESFICCSCKVPNEIENQPIDGWNSLSSKFCAEKEKNCWTE